MVQNTFDAIIIGAGMGGLTGALKLAANGKRVLLIERQSGPGGVASNFKRKGFVFEAVLHYVDSLGPGGEIRKFLDEYGVSKKLDFIEVREFGRVIYPEHDFVVGNDFEGLKDWMEENFPKELKGIERFFLDLKKFYRQFDHFDKSDMPMWLKLLISPIIYPSIIKASCLSLEQYITKEIKDKRLRAIIGTIWGFIGSPPSQISAFYFLIVFRGCWLEKTSFMRGAFNSLFVAMVERIRELGSEVRFNTIATEILTEKGRRVKAVRTGKGEEFTAKVVISNANAIETLSRLIDCDPLKKEYGGRLSALQKSLSAVHIYLGLDVLVESLGMKNALMYINTTYDHDESFRRCAAGDYHNTALFVTSHSMLDPGLAPAGKSTLCAMSLDSYSNWDNLSLEEYRKKKKEVADIILARLEKYLPGLSNHIEVLEVGTPKTMERYGCLPQGAIYGFAHTVGQSSLNRLPQNTRIKGLFLAGSWTQPGCGVHGCLVSGKDAASGALKFLKK